MVHGPFSLLPTLVNVWIAFSLLAGFAISEDVLLNLTFGLLNGGSEYFEPVEDGWLDMCNKLGVTCHYRVSPSGPCEDSRTEIVHEFLALGVNGIAMKPCKAEKVAENMTGMVDYAWERGVPIVTFDSDIPHTKRVAYVGTDNEFLGRTMARLLRQLRPEGGTFAVIGDKEERNGAFREEIMIYNDRKNRPHWYELPTIELDERDSEGYLRQMEAYALQNLTAMLIMLQTPMRHPNWKDFVDRYRNTTYIGVDGAQYQLDYLNQRYVDGLVGQLPYEIGSVSAQVLYDQITKGYLEKTFFPTNIVAYNLIPLELPQLDVDENLLGNLKYIGYICFGVVAFAAIGFVAWTLYFRKEVVVRAAQPFFLVMVACGVLIMSASLVTLSFDDGGDPLSMSTEKGIRMCMSTPWLLFIGFTCVFSALFSKTWRVNRLFHGKVPHARIQVTEKDVLTPFVVLLTCNIIVLVLWSVLDPLMYVRQEHDGTDYWNRVISTYGACRSDNLVVYLVPLSLLNFFAVALACWQAFQARDIESEFSEAKYIGLTMASLFQAFLTGIPVVVVVRDIPRSYYVVLSLIIFLLCFAILFLIFLPKIFIQREYAGKSEEEKKRILGNKIRRSSELKYRSAEFGHPSPGSSRGLGPVDYDPQAMRWSVADSAIQESTGDELVVVEEVSGLSTRESRELSSGRSAADSKENQEDSIVVPIKESSVDINNSAVSTER